MLFSYVSMIAVLLVVPELEFGLRAQPELVLGGGSSSEGIPTLDRARRGAGAPLRASSSAAYGDRETTGAVLFPLLAVPRVYPTFRLSMLGLRLSAHQTCVASRRRLCCTQ